MSLLLTSQPATLYLSAAAAFNAWAALTLGELLAADETGFTYRIEPMGAAFRIAAFDETGARLGAL